MNQSDIVRVLVISCGSAPFSPWRQPHNPLQNPLDPMNPSPLGGNQSAWTFWERSWVSTLPSGFLYRTKTRTEFPSSSSLFHTCTQVTSANFLSSKQAHPVRLCVFLKGQICVCCKPSNCLGHPIWQNL